MASLIYYGSTFFQHLLYTSIYGYDSRLSRISIRRWLDDYIRSFLVIYLTNLVMSGYKRKIRSIMLSEPLAFYVVVPFSIASSSKASSIILIN